MQLLLPVRSILIQLEDVIQPLSPEKYSVSLEVLSGASIGQHVRHTIEMFTCLLDALETGTVNYDNRQRDKVLEQDKEAAIEKLRSITHSIDRPDTVLSLHSSYTTDHSDTVVFNTTYYRELAYDLEHAVHHMALIKIGLKTIAPHVPLPENFGVAASTIQHKKSLHNV